MTSKDTLRRSVLDLRADRSAADRADDAAALAAHAQSIGLLTRARTVAVYLSMPSEPDTAPLIDELIRRRITVIVPSIAEGRQLVWTRFGRDTSILTGPLGVPQPEGGKAARLDDADLVFVPALAVDHSGNRLGRGAGYYDRALSQVSAPMCAIVNGDEVVAELPHEPHDVRVQMALTPTGLIRFGE